MQCRIPAGRLQQQHAPAVSQKPQGFCFLACGEDAIPGVLQTTGDGLHPLLLQQPDCWESELYQGVAPQATDSAVYTGGMGTDMVDKEEGKIDVDRANESAG